MKRFAIYIILAVFAVVTLVPSFAFGSYVKEFKVSTRRGRLYDMNDGNAKIIFDATLFTDKFRQAFAKKDVEIRHLEPFEADRSIAEQMELQRASWEVFVAMYTRKDYKEYSLGPNTFWKSYITTEDGEKIYPVKIEKVTIKPYWKVMFPNINRWAHAYRVTFPKVSLGKRVSFTLQSVVGERSITWKVE
jgi:hypothetical protein